MGEVMGSLVAWTVGFAHSLFLNAAVEWISMGHDVRTSGEILRGEPTGQGREQAGEFVVDGGRGDEAGLTAQLATTPGVLTVARVDADDEYS
jgi:hypothetical protein